MVKKHTILFIAVLALFAFTLSACGVPSPTTAPSPDTTPPTSASTEEATPLPTSGMNRLIGTWQWVAFSDPVQGETVIAKPENYLITFNEDGTVQVKADCNRAQGTYTADENTLKIELGPTTLVACGEGSRGDDFLTYLGYVAAYLFDGDTLLLDLKADGGTMSFRQVDGDSSGQEGRLPAELAANLDAYLESLIYTEGVHPEAAAPGIVLLVDTPAGRYLKAAGVANRDDNTPMQVDDHLEIGSNTKSFTVVLLMQLQEEGVLSLDDPLSKWLPEWAEKIPYGDAMILRQFANHTSGIWDYGDPVIGEAVKDPKALVKQYTPEELVQYAIDHGQPAFKPGEEGRWQYSNTGYILLGMVIEKATGKPLGELYQERIFQPLGMDTAVLINSVPENEEITTHGYWWEITGEDADGNSTYGNAIDVTNWNGSQAWAAGALAMSAQDLLTYIQALSSGQLFQHPDSLQDMLTFNPNGMDGAAPYGLGLIDFSPFGSVGYWGHEGQTPGFQSLWATHPEAGVTIIGLSNSGTFNAFGFLGVVEMLEAAQGELP